MLSWLPPTVWMSCWEDCCIPSRTRVSYNNDKPWFTAKLRQLRLQKEYVFRRRDRFKKSSTALARRWEILNNSTLRNSNTGSQLTTLIQSGRGSDRLQTTNLNPPTQSTTCDLQINWTSPIVTLRVEGTVLTPSPTTTSPISPTLPPPAQQDPGPLHEATGRIVADSSHRGQRLQNIIEQ